MESGQCFTTFDLPAHPTAEYCRYLRRMAYRYASRIGIAAQDREDCAGEFVYRILLIHRQLWQEGIDQEFSTAWLRRCATNHAVDFQRRQRRRACREIAMVSENANENHCAAVALTPEAHVVHRIFKDASFV